MREQLADLGAGRRVVRPELVDYQPGDRSRLTATERAIPILRDLERGAPMPPPILRPKPGGRYEIVDGNARVAAYRALGRPFRARLVTRRRNAGPEPKDRALWDAIVAEARGLVDEGRVPWDWPSLEATTWIEAEYLAAGGRFGSGPSRRAVRSYGELYDAIPRARDLGELAELWRHARGIQSQTLRETLGVVALERGRELGLSCPVRATPAACLEKLETYGPRPLFQNGLRRLLR